MFQAKSFCVVLLFCSTFMGCGGGSAPKPKTTEIATLAKSSVNSTAERIATSPKSASQEMALLLESLEAYARDYGGSFKELLATAKSVQSELSASPDQAKVESELVRLKGAADKLTESAK